MEQQVLKSGLYIVPTPIGNLQDITLRALEVLKNCDMILAEDTRVTGNLLKHFNIQNSLKPFHLGNEHKTLGHYISILQEGKPLPCAAMQAHPQFPTQDICSRMSVLKKVYI